IIQGRFLTGAALLRCSRFGLLLGGSLSRRRDGRLNFLDRPPIQPEAQAYEDWRKLVWRAPEDRHHFWYDNEPTVTGRSLGRCRGRIFWIWTPGQQRPDQIRETLQNINPNGTRAAHVIAARPIEGFRDALLGRCGRQPCPRWSRQIVDRQPMLARMLQRPEDQRQLRRPGLQQQRKINVERAESNRATTQLCTAGLV